MTLLLSLFLYAAQTDPGLDAIWQEANQRYRDGEHQQALDGYLALLDQGVDNGKLHYNLGNAYYRSGELGRAILHYHKARKFMPKDPDVAANLALANQKRVDPVIEGETEAFGDNFDGMLRQWPYAVSYFGALGLLALIGLIGLFKIIRPETGKWTGYVLVVGMVGATLLAAAAFVQHQRLTREDQAVVIAKKINVMSGPSTRETISFTIHEGIRCRILDETESWRRIRLANGYNGWLPRTAVEKI